MLLRVSAKPRKVADNNENTVTPQDDREVMEPQSPPTRSAPGTANSQEGCNTSTQEIKEPIDKKPRLEAQVSTSSTETVCPSYSETESCPHSNEQDSEENCVEKTVEPSIDCLSEREASSSQAASIHAGVSHSPALQPASNVPPTSSYTEGATASTPHLKSSDPAHQTISTPSQHRVSPGSNLVTPASTIDDLFSDNTTEKCFDDLVCDAIFGEDETVLHSPDGMAGGGGEGSSGSRRCVDGTSIQIQAAKDEMQKEKQKLLSNIEALKSELASKERLLVEKSEKEKEFEKEKKQGVGVIDSMQEELTCVICQELFVVAHTLTCAHSFCADCINAWMNSKKECPICRKPITTKPIHSLVLDNTIDKMVEKMDVQAREERKQLKESRIPKPAKSGMIDMLATASALGVLSRSGSTNAGSGATGGSGSRSNRGGASGSGHASRSNHSGASGSGRASGSNRSRNRGSNRHGTSSIGANNRSGRNQNRGGRFSLIIGRGSANSPIVLTETPPRGPHQHHTTHITIHDDDEEEDEEEEDGYYDEDDEDDYDDSEEDDDGEEGDPGLEGHYYGGYGRCYNCGKSKHSCVGDI